MRRSWSCSVLILAGAAFSSGPLGAVPGAGTVTLQWTAPGDDGVVGTAAQYDVRFNSIPITSANFSTSFMVQGEPAPLAPGNRQTFTVTGLTPNVPYYFAVKTMDDRGNWSPISNVVNKTATATVDVAPAPLVLGFSAPWPNPSSTSAHFELTLPSASPVHIEAYDAAGRRVRVIADGPYEAGRNQIAWALDGSHGGRLPPGMYFVRANVAGQKFVRRVLVTR